MSLRDGMMVRGALRHPNYCRGIDGKHYPSTVWLRRVAAGEVLRLLGERPDLTLRAVADLVGVSPATVLRYRRLVQVHHTTHLNTAEAGR